MLTVNYSVFRQELKSFLDKVSLHRIPMIVTRSKGEDVVVMSKSDYDSLEETFYLLRSPANAARLMKAIEEYNEGKAME
ncbi:Antitoxin YefM [compost metagenome]